MPYRVLILLLRHMKEALGKPPHPQGRLATAIGAVYRTPATRNPLCVCLDTRACSGHVSGWAVWADVRTDV